MIFKILWFFWSQYKKFCYGLHVNNFSKKDIVKVLIYSNFKINNIKNSHFGMLIAIKGIK